MEKENGWGIKKRHSCFVLLHIQPFRCVNFLNAPVALCTLLGGIVMYVTVWKNLVLDSRLIGDAFASANFGCLYSKTIGSAKIQEKCAFRLWGLIRRLCIPLYPFVWIISGIASLILKMFGINMKDTDESVTEEEIMSMVNEGHERGVLQASEAEMITNIFEFTETEASDIMTHRTNIVALDETMKLRDAVPFILRENQSRFPVYRDNMDDIVGILHLKDVMIANEDPSKGDLMLKDVDGLLREAYFIPETRNIDALFKEMQSQKVHMVIVVDEYGQTTGLVTMEDILEEIVGNIAG